MTITQQDWRNYARRLSQLNETAGELFGAYLERHGTGDTEALVQYASALVQKYGEGSAELACQMYDEVAQASGKTLPAAEPAEPASPMEVAKAVYGTLSSPPQMKGAVSRMVKQAGADTTLKNALRDGAEWAWVPQGDTCAFCITLASRGWQRASKKAIRKGHAEHIHAHCDCTYAIRFDSRTNVAGYDPDRYLKMYNDADGDINAMRRSLREENKEKINAQQRAAEHARRAREEGSVKKVTIQATQGVVTSEYIKRAHPGDGLFEAEQGYDAQKYKNEYTVAQWLHSNLGGDIKLLNESYIDGEKRADYLWNGAYWDLKTSSSEKSANSAIRKGLKQIREKPGGIILDFGENDFDSEALWDVVDKRMQWNHVDGSIDIMVLAKGQLIEVRRYSKK